MNNLKNPFSYGAITGESASLKYVRTGSLKLNKGDFVVVYSDGVVPILFYKEFKIVKKFDCLKKYFRGRADKFAGGEGTIVVYKSNL